MKKYISTILIGIIVIALSVLGFVFNPPVLNQNQLDTLLILGIICGASVLYCFVVGELSRNNSQMDKLWSILPIAYTWVIAAKAGFNPRTTIYAIIVTLWGIRLTSNFARKGAYSLKFWTGEEDYRWQVLRQKKGLNNRFVWALFNLFFISFYQNALVLAICLPSLAMMESTAALGLFDYLAIGLASFFVLIETIADEQQMSFYNVRSMFYKEGKKLEEMPYPYCLGFNTTGLWRFMRHPNYLAEQTIWMTLYLFVIGAGAATYGIFNWSMVGPLLLIFLFMGSSIFGEKVSSGKYPRYKDYQKQVFKYIPLRKFNPDK